MSSTSHDTTSFSAIRDSSMVAMSSLEILPDEILLQVCRYLRDADILYALFNLNTRLNATITRYCRQVDLCGVTYEQFNRVVANVLPGIASTVHSFVFHGYRERFLSAEVAAVFHARSMSVTFPQLQTITLYHCTTEKLLVFVEALQNLEQLVKLNIASMSGTVNESLLMKIPTANNGRLQSVLYDHNSASLAVPQITGEAIAMNIRTLVVEITDSQMLPNLFALIPNVRRLSVSVAKHSGRFEDAAPLIQLIDFELLSVHRVWSFEEMGALLRHMPSLQTLRFHISANDQRFVQQEVFAEISPRPIKQIHFLIFYDHTHCGADLDINSLISSWSSTFPIRCFVNAEEEFSLILTTSSFSSCPTWLDLPAAFGKQLGRDCRYTQLVDDLYIDNAMSLVDVLLTVQHFHRLRKLTIGRTNVNGMSLVSSCR